MFSLNMIFDELPGCSVLSAPAKYDTFDMALVSPYAAAGDEEQLVCPFEEMNDLPDAVVQRFLFLGGLYDSLAFLRANKAAFALVVTREKAVPAKIAPVLGRCFVVYTPTSVAQTVLEAQRACDKFQRWQERMRLALLEGGSYQHLVDASEQVLGNFVSITDSSFRLLAHTRGVEPEDGISKRLVEKGYHDMEAIDFFKSHKLFETWKSESGLQIHEHSLTAETESASYIFRMQGTYFMHVVMRFNRLPRTRGRMDIFNIFIDHVKILARRDWQGARNRGTSFARTVIGLISGKLTASTLVEEELTIAGIGRNSQFLVMCFSPNERSQKVGENERRYYSKVLEAEFPEAKIVEYGDVVIALLERSAQNEVSETRAAKEYMQEVRNRVGAFLNVHGGLCGASDLVSTVYNVRVAYQEAHYALSRCLAPIISPGSKTASFLTTFQDAYLDFLLFGIESNKELALYCRRNSVTRRIAADDNREGTNNLELLVSFLLHERHATKAAQALYMHRNSLLYRVDALSKKYDIDLDSPDQRQIILLEYRYMLETSLVRHNEE